LEALALAREPGVELSINGDKLHYKAENGRPAGLIDVLREHKAELMALLGVPDKLPHAGAYAPNRCCPGCKLRFWWRRPDCGWLCGVCHPSPVQDRVVERAAELFAGVPEGQLVAPLPTPGPPVRRSACSSRGWSRCSSAPGG
jgi:hypothetical protein